jgi:hypothetical protein
LRWAYRYTSNVKLSCVCLCPSHSFVTDTWFKVPNPADSSGSRIDAAIQTALHEAEEKGISGRDITPYLLGRLNDLTDGDSLESNIALIRCEVSVSFDVSLRFGLLPFPRGLSPMSCVVWCRPVLSCLVVWCACLVSSCMILSCLDLSCRVVS